jgi:hypothetical protein
LFATSTLPGSSTWFHLSRSRSILKLHPARADRLLALDLETVALDFAALDGGDARV